MGLVTLVTAGSATVKDMTEEEFRAEVEQKDKDDNQSQAAKGDSNVLEFPTPDSETKH